MLTFGAPHMLILLLVVPGAGALLWWGARTRRARLARWADPRMANRLTVGKQPWRRTVRGMLLLAGLAGCALALLRPRWGYHYEEVTRRGIDLVIVVDVSESMRAEDVSPSRLERAKREIADFLNLVEGDRVALAAAAGTSFIQCPLTLDYGAVRAFLTLIDTDLIPTPGTDLSAALLTAAKALEPSGPSRGKAVVLISDGGDLEGNPAAVAATLHEQNITLYTVGIGDPAHAVPIRTADGRLKEYEGKVVTTRLEEGTLTAIATAGGGVYVRAVTGDLDLEKIYADIRERHTAAELGRSERKVYHERFAWPLGLGLFCLLLEACISERGRTVIAAAACAVLLARPAAADTSRAVARGLAAYEREAYPDAVTAFTEAVEQAPADARTLFDLGAAQYQAQQYDAALQQFDAATAAADDPLLRAQSLYNAGNAYAHLGQFDRAAEAFERSLRLHPADGDAKANLELVRRLIEEREEEQNEREQEQEQGEGKGEENTGENDQGESADADAQSENGQPAEPQQGDNSRPDEDGQPQDGTDAPQQSERQESQTPAAPQAADGQQSDAQEGDAEAATTPGAMSRAEAEHWLQQLPSEDAEALKDFWRRQQPRPAAPRRRDW